MITATEIQRRMADPNTPAAQHLDAALSTLLQPIIDKAYEIMENNQKGIDAMVEPSTAESRAGKDLLIADVKRVTDQVENISIERINSLIARLESLKSAIVLEHRAGVERITSFVELVDQGLREVAKLEELMPKLEQTTRS